jgi:hypothetical protein
MLLLQLGDADHEKSNATQNAQNNEQQKENRPSGGVTTAIDQRNSTGRTSEELNHHTS